MNGVRMPFEGPEQQSRPAAPRPVVVPQAPSAGDAGGMDRDMLRQLILQELRELTRGQS
jgi:hypothetical protein